MTKIRLWVPDRLDAYFKGEYLIPYRMLIEHDVVAYGIFRLPDNWEIV